MSLWYARNMKLIDEHKYAIEKQMMMGHDTLIDFDGILRIIGSAVAEIKRLDRELEVEKNTTNDLRQTIAKLENNIVKLKENK